MNYSKEYFDFFLDRRNTGSIKWDGCNQKFNEDPSVEMIPMWIADSDFRSPQELIETLHERVNTSSYGYTVKPDSLYRAIIDWIRTQYHWEVEKDWIVFTPGVIPGLHIAVQNFTKCGEGVIIQTPVYYPFMNASIDNCRNMVNNRLIEKDREYFIDFEDLEAKVKDPANKVMILSNPHNPVGRVWTAEELTRIGDLCADNGVLLISDELHADLMMDGFEHQALCRVHPRMKDYSITYYAASKTFNLAGLQTAFAIIPNREIREKFIVGLNANRIFNLNWFSAAMVEACYTKSGNYAEEERKYLNANMDYMKDFIDSRMPLLKMRKPDATFLVWVDFRGTGMTTKEIEDFVTYEAHLGTDLGSWFGPGGDGFIRINVACPRCTLEKAMEWLEKAYRNHFA